LSRHASPGENRVDKRPVVSRRVVRFAPGTLAVLIASLCSACLATPDDNFDDNPSAGANRAATTAASPAPPTPSMPTPSMPTPSVPTPSVRPEQETRAFGKAYTWDDGVTVTVGKPKSFRPSAYAAVEKGKRYVKFTVTVVNKSNKSVDLGLTYISVQSKNQEADEVFDSGSGLKGPPDTKVLKGRVSVFDVGFGVADPRDVVMEIALHSDLGRPSLLYST
jgi:hypothetical protein